MKKIIGEAVLMKKGKKDKLTVGNIDIKRDFGFAPQYIEAIYLMMQDKKLNDYIVYSGKSYSLRSVIAYVFDKLGLEKIELLLIRNCTGQLKLPIFMEIIHKLRVNLNGSMI